MYNRVCVHHIKYDHYPHNELDHELVTLCGGCHCDVNGYDHGEKVRPTMPEHEQRRLIAEWRKDDRRRREIDGDKGERMVCDIDDTIIADLQTFILPSLNV